MNLMLAVSCGLCNVGGGVEMLISLCAHVCVLQALGESEDLSDEERQALHEVALGMGVDVVEEAAQEVQGALTTRGDTGGVRRMKEIDWGAIKGSWQLPEWRWPRGSMYGMGGGGSDKWGWGGGQGGMMGGGWRKGGGGKQGGVSVGGSEAHELMRREVGRCKAEGREVDVREVMKEAMKQSMMRSAEAGESLSVEQLQQMMLDIDKGISQVIPCC